MVSASVTVNCMAQALLDASRAQVNKIISFPHI